jgi:hypothetical protein
MKLISKITVMLLVYLLLSILFVSAPVMAEMIAIPIYKYTGNSFNEFSNTTNPPYSNISGSFEVVNPLGNNWTSMVISPIVTRWSFDDGQNFLSEGAGATITLFDVSTSSTGNIIAPWHIQIFMNLSATEYVILESFHSNSENNDSSLLRNGYAEVDDNGGKWSISYRMIVSSSLPEPSTLLLFGAGLAGLLGFGRKFKG